ncbi:MAG TPA: 4-hydroxybenzoyl-CoA reductase subunit beta [Alphaproteobacteria bacterium]|nr:4-hydroxybenzoyl-CoA reductase subunit beta [Alphaproteobacteria bacterium]
MEYMPEFDTHRPATLDEAIQARQAAPEAKLIAGGTDLVPNIRRGIAQPKALIDLNGIEEMHGITALEDGGLRIGAAVTIAELLGDGDIRATHTGLIQAAESIAANSHRQVGTVGGNLCLDTRCVFYNQSEWWRRSNAYCLKYRGEICHVAPKGNHCFAAFSGDLAPALIVLKAEVEIAAPGGSRTVPLTEIYRDDGMHHLTLGPEEIIAAVLIPAQPGGLRTGYAKARVRSAIDFPLAGVAAALRREGDAVTDLRLALTGTNSMPLSVQGTGELTGGPLDDDMLEALDGLVRKQIQPMNSSFTPPGYRRRVVSNLTRKVVTGLYNQG